MNAAVFSNPHASKSCKFPFHKEFPQHAGLITCTNKTVTFTRWCLLAFVLTSLPLLKSYGILREQKEWHFL